MSVKPTAADYIDINYITGSDKHLEDEIRAGKVVIGTLDVYKRWRNNLCFIKCNGISNAIAVNNAEDRGPAIAGDIVAVRIERWQEVAQVDDDDPSLDTDVKTKMNPTLPDGRRVQNVKIKGGEGSAKERVDIRLQREIKAPSISELNFPDNQQAVGKVVRVLWRHFNAFQIGKICEGVVKPEQKNLYGNYFYRFKLYNPKLPQVCIEGKNIPVQFHSEINEHFFLLRLQSDEEGYLSIYKGDIVFASLISSLGNTSSTEASNLIISQIHGIHPESFPEDAEECVPKDFKIPDTETLKQIGRRDLREEEFVCTIDPETARDLDDALSIRRTKRGTYKVGVHIADVSFFVQPDTPLDEEARSRCTSVYFVDKVVPMLPRRLCEDYCSLNPSEDKLAFSSLFELDEEGNILNEWFGQTVIRSRCRLAYEQAQEIIDTDRTALDVSRESELTGMDTKTLESKVFESVKMLYKLASVLRKTRLERGRLTISNTRLAFSFEDNETDAKLSPNGFFVKTQIHANWLVEEFMLLANTRTVEKIVQFLPDGALLRRHAPPEKKKLSVLKENLSHCHIQLVGGNAKGLQETLDRAKEHKSYLALCQLMKYSLCRAEYFANDLTESTYRSHFALGFPWYCHFTSPIRRYCDIISHRQLLVALEVEKIMKETGQVLPTVVDGSIEAKPGAVAFDPSNVVDIDSLETQKYCLPRYEIEEITERANVKKEDARLAGDASLQLYFCLYLRALQRISKKNDKVPKILRTRVTVLQLKGNSMLLFSDEIATEVEVGLLDDQQRFIPMASEPVTRDKEGAKDSLEKEVCKDRPPPQQKTFLHHAESDGNSNSCAPYFRLNWGVDPSGAEVEEKLRAFDVGVVSLGVSTYTGMMTLKMILLPPWERAEYFRSGEKIPNSLADL